MLTLYLCFPTCCEPKWQGHGWGRRGVFLLTLKLMLPFWKSQVGLVMVLAQLIKYQVQCRRPRWGPDPQKWKGQIMGGVGLFQPPCFCRFTGCEFTGSTMFLHGWMYLMGKWWDRAAFPCAAGSWSPQTTALLTARLYGGQTAAITALFWTRTVEQSSDRKMEGTFSKWKMEKALWGRSPQENKVEKSKQFYCFYLSTLFCCFICGLFFFCIHTSLFLSP